MKSTLCEWATTGSDHSVLIHFDMSVPIRRKAFAVCPCWEPYKSDLNSDLAGPPGGEVSWVRLIVAVEQFVQQLLQLQVAAKLQQFSANLLY